MRRSRRATPTFAGVSRSIPATAAALPPTPNSWTPMTSGGCRRLGQSPNYPRAARRSQAYPAARPANRSDVAGRPLRRRHGWPRRRRRSHRSSKACSPCWSSIRTSFRRYSRLAKYRWVFHGKLAEAVQILEHAIALDPRNPEPRQTAMAVYLDLGDEQAARAVVAGTPQVARDRAHAFMYAGDWRAAGRAAYDAELGARRL